MKKITQTLFILLFAFAGRATLVNDYYTVAKDRTITLDVTSNDNLYGICGTNSTGVICANGLVWQSQNGGTLSLNWMQGTVTYTPPLGFSGNDRFSYGVDYSPGGTTPCDTAEVFLWVLGNTNCDTTHQVNYNYSFASYAITLNVVPTTPPSGYFFQNRKLYMNGSYYAMSGNSITQNLPYITNDTLIFGVEEFYINRQQDTCMYYRTDTIVHPGCDAGYNPGFNYTLAGDTITMMFDTATPNSSVITYEMQYNRILVNGTQIASYVVGSAPFTYVLNQFPQPWVVCVEEWWTPLPFGDTCTYMYCDTVGATGISETNTISNLKTYPNPVSDVLIIENDLEGNDQSLVMTNILGEVILTKTIGGRLNKIDVSTFKTGTYLVFIYNENGSRISNGRFVKQ